MNDRRMRFLAIQDKWAFKTTYGVVDASKVGGDLAIELACTKFGGELRESADNRYLIKFSEWIDLEKAMDEVESFQLEAQLLPARATELFKVGK